MNAPVDYLALARRLSLAEGRATLERFASKSTAMRRNDICCCSAYDFPHRPGSGVCCPAPEWGGYDASNTEEAALFDLAEARAVNSGAW